MCTTKNRLVWYWQITPNGALPTNYYIHTTEICSTAQTTINYCPLPMVYIANGFVKILTEILEDDEDNFIESI